ncbi:MAG: hypothetical protein GF310_02130 [candidate division Zixibacteria bacterium]|nr:hypothetical protein [candidate division Zixibacteria bacterium]
MQSYKAFFHNQGACGIFLILFLIFSFASLSAADDPIEVEYSFDHPYTETILIGGSSYDRITMPNLSNGGNPGEPSLPAMGANILLPYGTEVDRIEVIPGGRRGLGDGYVIEPVAPQVRLSADPSEIKLPEPDQAVYASDQPFPGNVYEEITTQSFRGYRILTLKLQPVQYIPSSGELYYFRDLKIVVHTINTGKEAATFRGLDEDEEEVLERIDNPDQVWSYNAAPKRGGKSYDMLIITTSSLVSAFQQLKDYHDTTGIATEIHTLNDVGASDPDAVRSYINDRYINDGISYVIIGADDDVIPAKDLYVRTSDDFGAEIEYEMPGDLYFVCLDGTWNYDNDSYWGEPTDGDGGGDVDLTAELSIGRAAVDNSTEATRFVDKTIQYVNSTDSYLQNVLMVGEHLGFGGEAEYAALAMDRNIDSSDAYGYSTIGIPSNQYSVDRLYERDWAGNSWPQSELTTRINNGVHILNHLGHGSPDYAMKLYNSDIYNDLTNLNHCFVYSQTCLAGHFDGTECWAETMNIKTDNGGFAVVMNARYGFGEYSSTDGASQRFNREFWDAVYNPLENKKRIGDANRDSKEDNLYRVNEECMRWCYYEINLFGDPTVEIRAARGVSFEFPNGLPETVLPETPTTISVIVNGSGEGMPLSGTGQLHYALDGGSYQSVYMTEIFPNEYEAVLPAADCDSWYDFYFSADEELFGTFYDTDSSNAHYARAATDIITPLEDDFETDLGWMVSGSVDDGQWERGDPVGGGDRGDPSDDFDGSGQCYLTDNVDDNSDVDGGTTILTSPSFDLSAGDGTIHYARWFSNTYGASPNNDIMEIFISNDDGSTWTLVETVGPTGDEAGGGWYENTFVVSEFVLPTAQMKMKFEASDLGDGSVVEAAIDDFWVKVYECYTGVMITTDSLPDWTMGVSYSQQLESIGGSGVVTWEDKNGDLAGTGLLLSTDGVLSGQPAQTGTISFTALITDESSNTDEKAYEFQINPEIAIITSGLPSWTEGAEYSQQLSFEGGTAPAVWSDSYSDLEGTGLTLSPGGALIGTPSGAGEISFTARVVDFAGASDEKPLTVTINPAVQVSTESVNDWTVNRLFNYQLEVAGGTGDKTWTDKNSDLDGTGLSLSSEGIISGNPMSAQTISFTAQAVDQVGSAGEKAFEFVINPEVAITTEIVPDGAQFSEYSLQLECSGGTMPMVWTDKNGDLEETGLVITEQGTLEGTPLVYGELSFTAEVSDCAGCKDEKVFTLTLERGYVCGDATIDGVVNVSDAVYIINYVFISGPAPDPIEAGDTNCDSNCNVSDAVQIINYVFIGGNTPCDTDGDGEPDC